MLLVSLQAQASGQAALATCPDETQSPVPVLSSVLLSAAEASVSDGPLRPANTRWDRRPEDVTDVREAHPGWER